MTAIYYILACDDQGFRDDSWAAGLKKNSPDLSDGYIFLNTFKSLFEVVLLEGIGVLKFSRLIDVFVMICFTVVGIMLFTYIAADYSATMTLNDYEL